MPILFCSPIHLHLWERCSLGKSRSSLLPTKNLQVLQSLPGLWPHKHALKDKQVPCPHFTDGLTGVGKYHYKQSPGLSVCPQRSPKMPLIHSQVALQSCLVMPRCLLMLPETGGFHLGQGAGAGPRLPLATGARLLPAPAPAAQPSSTAGTMCSNFPCLTPVVLVRWGLQHAKGFV